ncbi:hypothetical protein MNBD_GAMMA01-510 [hydrothermal vent metagenome]|uniref:Ribbon-helix-helix protein CopG domain-containing protein n=1 Tax=hydrothermal vent metagenome TaxID=652676 RepID=A0A3B0UWB3_9ZZZZ
MLTINKQCITVCNTFFKNINNMLTIRLDNKMEQEINAMAKQLQITKSDLIRECIAEYIVKFDKTNAWELGAKKFGKYASGKANLSQDRKQLLTEIIKNKNAQHSH